jgi:hypothetical protein
MGTLITSVPDLKVCAAGAAEATARARAEIHPAFEHRMMLAV